VSPDFAQQHNTARGRPEDAQIEQIDLWNVVFYDEYTRDPIATVGQLFDEILRPAPGGPRIGPDVFDVGAADSGAGAGGAGNARLRRV
jgi:hypothetical protein